MFLFELSLKNAGNNRSKLICDIADTQCRLVNRSNPLGLFEEK